MDEQMLDGLIKKAELWIVDQRNAHINEGRTLDAEERSKLERYFEPAFLDKVRIAEVDYIENPPFYPELNEVASNEIMDFTQMSGIAFIDCILLSRSKSSDPQFWMAFLFHEMVHIAQYEVLGVEQFARRYVRGWLEGGFDYWNIPLEREAYELLQKAEMSDEPFSVVDVLRQRYSD
jgi:hypothetical protein